MNDSEIGTSLFSSLSKTDPKTTSDIARALEEESGMDFSDSEIFGFLLKAEVAGLVARIKTERFDESRPVTTISWLLKADPDGTEKNRFLSQVASQYVKEAIIVASQPIFLTAQGVNLKNMGQPLLNVKEAMEKIILDSVSELRIACPYYDELFIDVLNSHVSEVRKLKQVSVLAENMDPILIKATRLFPNLKVRTLYKGATQSNSLKIQGIHAKLMIADVTEVLVGSFNFQFSHIYYNLDLGVLAKGEIAEHFAKIFDSVWRSGP